MKKILYITGIGLAIGSLSYYFKKQYELALQYNYKFDDVKILTLTTDKATIEVAMTLENKSSFEVEILEYDLKISYKNIQIAETASSESFKIVADGAIKLKAKGTIVFEEAKQAVLPFALNVLQQKPVNVTMSGFVKFKFLSITQQINFNKESYQYSANLLKEYGLLEKYKKLQEKIPILKKIG